MDDWWSDLLEGEDENPRAREMLRLIAYDIADAKRLQRVAKICQDYGIRIQKSLFECWLEDAGFQSMWETLVKAIDQKTDRLVAYTLQADSVKRRMSAGDTMIVTSHEKLFLF